MVRRFADDVNSKRKREITHRLDDPWKERWHDILRKTEKKLKKEGRKRGNKMTEKAFLSALKRTFICYLTLFSCTLFLKEK